MAELSVRELNKYYGENHVLKGLTFEVYKGERVGLLGKNGSGKTTFFKVVSGMEPYESGFCNICTGRKTGILDQIPEYPDDSTVLEVLKTSFSELVELQARMQELEAVMLTDSSPAILSRYGSIQTKFDALGGYTMDSRITRICSGLHIDSDMQSQFFNSLSGGEKTRVNLARIMLLEADILLLDEPTNHLDVASVEWLEDYLKQKQTQEALQKPFSGVDKTNTCAAAGKPVKVPEIQQERFIAGKCSPLKSRTTEELEQKINVLESRIKKINLQMEGSSSDYLLLNELISEKEKLMENLDMLYEEWMVQTAE